jgi:class 3 adenylate cyclase
LYDRLCHQFADVVGFTAWSSVREPTHVFALLETLYAAFDAIARRRRIFKVETIGDCYVAVAGLPEAMKDHAVVMAKFASDIMKQVHKSTRKLEVSLGPDTGDLSLRIGLHSGPVTAGVLRGERARFQLFGDTVNTAARMEQAGMKDKIQISQATADYIIAAGRRYVPFCDKHFIYFVSPNVLYRRLFSFQPLDS